MNDELVIEPGRTFRNEWTDLWRYRELFYILARCGGALQADGDWGGLGGYSTVCNDGHLHHRI